MQQESDHGNLETWADSKNVENIYFDTELIPIKNVKDSQVILDEQNKYIDYISALLVNYFKSLMWFLNHAQYLKNISDYAFDKAIQGKVNNDFIEENLVRKKSNSLLQLKSPKISILSPADNSVIDPSSNLSIKLNITGTYAPQKTDVYINNKYVLTSSADPLNINFTPSDIGGLSADNTLSVTVYDAVYNKGQASTTFRITQP